MVQKHSPLLDFESNLIGGMKLAQKVNEQYRSVESFGLNQLAPNDLTRSPTLERDEIEYKIRQENQYVKAMLRQKTLEQKQLRIEFQ